MTELATFEEIVLEEEALAVLQEARNAEREARISKVAKEATEEALALLESKPNRRADRTVQINIRCSPELREQIRQKAAASGTDMNSWILQAASDWLEKTT